MNACKKIKILYAISTLANQGPTRVLLNVVRNLDRRHFDPMVVTLRPEKDSSLIDQFQETGVPIVQLGDSKNGKPAGTIQRLYALRKILIHEHISIAHAHCPRSLFFLSGATPRSVKSAYTVHVYPDTQFKAIFGRFKGPAINAGANIALRFIDQPIACADSVAAEYFEKRGYILPAVNNGIEPVNLTSYGERNKILQDLGLDPNQQHLLFIGRLSAEKRITELVRTFAALNISKINLVVVGSGPEETELQTMPKECVHLFGFHEDIRPFLAACDYYISPSATEGLANSLLEAMSVGMPSLLSDIPSHRFVIQKSKGFVAQLFDLTSPKTLIAGIKVLQQLDSVEIRNGIRDNFMAHFHAKEMTRGYEALYREMIA